MKKTNLISLIVFVVALVWVFTLDNKTIRNLQSKVLGVFGIAHSAAASVAFDSDLINGEEIGPEEIAKRYEKDELARRYSQLLRELFELRAWRGQIQILRDENKELKRSLNFVEYYREQDLTLIAARVIDRQSDSWWKTVIIDKGAKDGVMENSTVMTPVPIDETDSVEGALVGKVTVVEDDYSVVVLTTDEECHVAAYVHEAVTETSAGGGPQRVQGILSGAPGAGTTVPHLILRNLPKEADRFGVRAKAKVYSSGIKLAGIDGVFPSGFLLGYVQEFEVKDIDAEARVAPAIKFNSLSYVFVLIRSPGDSSITPAPRPSDRVSAPAPRAVPPAQPVTPTAQPVTPAAQPVTPAAQPVTPAPQPEVPTAKPVTPAVPAATPVIPRARPVGDDLD